MSWRDIGLVSLVCLAAIGVGFMTLVFLEIFSVLTEWFDDES